MVRSAILSLILAFAGCELAVAEDLDTVEIAVVIPDIAPASWSKPSAKTLIELLRMLQELALRLPPGEDWSPCLDPGGPTCPCPQSMLVIGLEPGSGRPRSEIWKVDRPVAC